MKNKETTSNNLNDSDESLESDQPKQYRTDIDISKDPISSESVARRRAAIKRALQMTSSLDIPEELKEPGYVYRLVSDEKPNNLKKVIDLGYTPVVDPKTNAPYTRYAGTTDRGTQFYFHAFKIAEFKKKEIELIKQERNREMTKAMFEKTLENIPQEDLYTTTSSTDGRQGNLDSILPRVKNL